jgi:hypothetical protein
MTPENFTYWLNGFVELNGTPPTPEQWDCIKEHLKLVFTKETPELKESISIPKWNIDPKFTSPSPLPTNIDPRFINPPSTGTPPFSLPTTACTVVNPSTGNTTC